MQIYPMFEQCLPISVHGNRQSYKSAPSHDIEIEQIIKSQLKTEYEFYEFLKKRLHDQADKIVESAPN